MNDKSTKLTEENQYAEQVVIPPAKRPDELSGLHIEAKFRISDPESGNVIVEGRA